MRPRVTVVAHAAPVRRAAAVVLPAWVLTLGVDLFLHAGALAGFYVRPIPFLLPASIAFRRIPAGYLSFLLLTAGLYWLLERLDVRGAGPGFRVGAAAGLLVWGALALGLWSIATAPPDLLVAWWVGQGLELGVAGAVMGAARGGMSGARVWRRVVVAVALLVALVIALQTAGIAPAVRLT